MPYSMIMKGGVNMPLTNEDRLLFDRMNKRMNEFTKRGLRNEMIDIVQHELESIYINEQETQGTNLHRTNFHKFSMNRNLSEETLDDLRGLAKGLEKAKTSKISYYRKNPTVTTYAESSYETLKTKNYGITDFQSFINFIDDRNNAMESQTITDALASTQWAELYGYGIDKGLDSDTINKVIEDSIKKYKNGDTLMINIFNEIDKKYNKIHNKGVRRKNEGKS